MVLTTLIVLLLGACSLEVVSSKSPILIVPGHWGSRLETQVTSSETPCECCTYGWTPLWYSMARRENKPSCFLNELSLVYNNKTNNYSNATGAEVSVPGFGSCSSVEYLDVDGGNQTEPEFNLFVDYFVKRGYERNKTIRAAPYDWRLAPGQLKMRGYYTQVQSLVEKMHNESGGEKVTLVAHSMGGPVTLYFLTSVVTQEWKDKYINAFVPLSAAWAGTVDTLPNEIFPPSDEVPIFEGLNFRPVVRTFQGIIWLMPEPSVWGNLVLITTPTRNYTAKNYETLFTDIGYPNGYQMYKGITDLYTGFPAPNVPVHCFYGTDNGTPEVYIYNGSFPNSAPVNTIMGGGDGVVNLRSSKVCLNWAKDPKQTKPFTSQTFPGVIHFNMIRNETVFKAVEKVVLK